MWSPRQTILIGLLISCMAAPALIAQTTSSSPPKPAAAASDSVRACIEQLDIFSCERAEKLRLPPKEKAEIFIYQYSAGPLCSPELPLDKAIKLDPQNALAYFLKAEAILCTGNRDAAIPLYIKAIELNPEWKPYYVDVGLLMNLGCAGCDSIVLKIWQLALETAPDDPRVLAGYGNALLSQKKTLEAQTMFRKALDRSPSDGVVAFGLCQIYIGSPGLGSYRSFCETAIPGISYSELGSLAYQLEQKKDYSLAEQAYRRAITISSRDSRKGDRLNLAAVLLYENKAAEAATIYRDYLATNPADAGTWMDPYANALERSGEIKKAEEEYLRAVDLHYECGTLSGLGGFYFRQKRYGEAVPVFEKALQENWDCHYVIPQLRDAFAKLGQNHDQELAAFEDKLIAVARPAPEVQNSDRYYRFAKFLEELGRLEDAALAYRKAADLDTNEVPPLGGLGEVFYALRRYQQAVAAYEEAEHRQSGYLDAAPELKKHYLESLAALKGKKP
jgi:tetratricopeptide (TPR) repeat protein